MNIYNIQIEGQLKDIFFSSYVVLSRGLQNPHANKF